jgi:hypothetical protein
MTINPPAKSFIDEPEISNLQIAAADPPGVALFLSKLFKPIQSVSKPFKPKKSSVLSYDHPDCHRTSSPKTWNRQLRNRSLQAEEINVLTAKQRNGPANEDVHLTFLNPVPL